MHWQFGNIIGSSLSNLVYVIASELNYLIDALFAIYLFDCIRFKNLKRSQDISIMKICLKGKWEYSVSMKLLPLLKDSDNVENLLINSKYNSGQVCL